MKDRIYYQEGDAIEGERITFEFRKFNVYKSPIHGRKSKHRAQAGKMDNAFCVISKRFRHIPERKQAE
jgi:hypothetical protein